VIHWGHCVVLERRYSVAQLPLLDGFLNFFDGGKVIALGYLTVVPSDLPIAKKGYFLFPFFRSYPYCHHA